MVKIAAAIICLEVSGDQVTNLARVLSGSGIHRVAVWLNGALTSETQAQLDVLGVQILGEGANAGVGRALNGLARWAMDQACEAAIAFDQDSLITKESLQTLICEFNQLNQAEDRSVRVAGLGPRLFDASEHQPLIHYRPYGLIRRPMSFPVKGGEPQTTDHLITSAMVFGLESYKSIGPFCEDYFIDMIDLEWCLRARAKGFELLVSQASTMRQRIGLRTKTILRRFLFVHSPKRNFTLIRNSIWMIRSAPMSHRRRINEVIHLILRIIHVVLIGDRRSDRVKQVSRGLIEGVLTSPRQ